MRDLVIKFTEEKAGKTKEELSATLDQEIEEFSKYMSTLGDWKAAGPLTREERALIKSYLVAKLTGKVD